VTQEKKYTISQFPTVSIRSSLHAFNGWYPDSPFGLTKGVLKLRLENLGSFSDKEDFRLLSVTRLSRGQLRLLWSVTCVKQTLNFI